MCCQVCRGSLRWQVFKRSNPGQIEDGIVWCIACGYWYPIEDSLLEFLAADLAYTADRDRFWEKYRTQLEAIGLHPVGNSGQTSGPQRTQQEHFDWYANNNEQSYTTYEQMPFWHAVDDRVFTEWRKRVLPGKWLLDVGCAQGRATLRFADLPVHIVGFDVSKALVRQAIDRYRGEPRCADAS